MQKLSTTPRSTGLGALLLASLSRPQAIKTSTPARTPTAPIVKAALKSPPVTGRSGLFEPMPRKTATLNAAPRTERRASTAGSRAPVLITMPFPDMGVVGDILDPRDFNSDDDANHVNARQFLEAAAARAALHQQMRDALTARPKPSSAPAPITPPRPAMRAPGEAAGTNYGTDIDLDNPLHVHAVMCRQTAAAHAALLDEIKAALRPQRSPSIGPEAL